MSRLSRVFACMALCAAPLCVPPSCAQAGTAPVFVTPPDAPYPVQARTARLGGEAIVAFSIEASGKTGGVHAVSGPNMLTRALQDEIRGWRFVTPLPHDAEKDFVADYVFTIFQTEEQAGKPEQKDGVQPNDAPAADREAADKEEVEPGYTAAVSGVVRSANNRQTIDATPLVRSK